MGYVKILKTKAYFKRYQVKFRRRRQGKTDYQARTRLINQDKNKYNTPKYRLVVRFTNRDIVAQVIFATIKGDIVVSQARSQELKQDRYGLPVGLTNYAAGYCTGLLLARRLLKKVGLADKYTGVEKADGQFFLYSKPNQRAKARARRDGRAVDNKMRPFTALLDVGLRRTTTGAKVFSVLKGAVDGGVCVPHSPNRFAGFKDGKLDAGVLRGRIFGAHVAAYMKKLKEEDEETYKKRFSRFIAANIGPDDLEALYAKVHKNIRANPDFVSEAKGTEHKDWRKKRMSYAQRKDRVRQKIVAFGRKAAAAALE